MMIDFGSRLPMGSRGNQEKFCVGDEVVKIDTYIDGKRVCAEGLREVLCSRILSSASFPVDHVDYRFCRIQVNDTILSGCISDNFIPPGSREYTLQELYDAVGKERKLDRILSRKWPFQTVEKAIHTIIHDLKKIGVRSAGTYIYAMIFFDTIFHNIDRHTNNYSFLSLSDGSIRPAPLFDYGMSFDVTLHARFTPPKLLFHSAQDAVSFLRRECSEHGMGKWGIPDALLFSETDFEAFCSEAVKYYTDNELCIVKSVLCETVLDFPDLFPNLEPTRLVK